MWRVGHNGGISEMNRQKCCGGKKVPAMSRGYAAQRPASHCRRSGNSVGKEVHKSAALVKRFFWIGGTLKCSVQTWDLRRCFDSAVLRLGGWSRL